MVTPRRSPYDKFFDRMAKAAAAALVDPDDERMRARADELWFRQLHWESHEAELEGCEWCRQYPPLSR